MSAEQTSRWIACEECDALYPRPVVPGGCEVRCARCGALLQRCCTLGPEHSVAWALAAVMLWIGANVSPFMVFTMAGNTQVSRLSEGVLQLARADRWGLATLVLACAIVVPLARLMALLWMQLPLLFGHRPWLLRSVWKASRFLAGWGMIDVFLLGAIVALVKFGDYGEIDLGHGFVAFVGLVLTSSAAHSCFDPEQVWQALERR